MNSRKAGTRIQARVERQRNPGIGGVKKERARKAGDRSQPRVERSGTVVPTENIRA